MVCQTTKKKKEFPIVKKQIEISMSVDRSSRNVTK